MGMKFFLRTLMILAFGCAPAMAVPNAPFIYNDGLAPRDEWGRLYQSPNVLPTDLEPRYSVRSHYYYMGTHTLQNDPAYVAAVQTALRRLGYYCGETDGVYGPETSDAVARLQKNYLMRVTGNLNVGVRRALRLP